MAAKKPRRAQPITLTEPGAIKALAHPARLAILDELRDGTSLTATEGAELVGMSASAMSYHLRALEKWGLIERAPDTGDGRERPWRSLSSGGWRVSSSSEPVTAAATSAVLNTVFDTLRDAMLGWNEVEHDQPTAWQEAGTIIQTSVWLTPAEARELASHVTTTIDKYDRRTANDHPRGARRVRLGLIVAPLADD